MVRKAATQGRAMISVMPMARFCSWEAPAASPAATRRLMVGRSTVPAAMPITPTGSW